MTATLNPNQLKQELAQFTGDLERFRHWANRKVIYTPGVNFLAEQAEAFWLIDAIVSYYGSPPMRQAITEDPRLTDMQFWTLAVEDNAARLVMNADVGERPAIQQEIPYTDFPLPSICIWAAFDGEHWTLYLPSEH